MNIAIDIRSLMDGRLSGVEQYTTHIIRALLRVAPQHTYHLFYNSARSVKLPEFQGNIKIHALGYPNKLFNTAQWAAGLPKWDALVPADVFFIPNSRLVPLSGSKPMVVVAHDLSFERFPEFLDARRRAWHTFMNPRTLMQRANHVIAVSDHTKHDVQRLYGIEPNKISTIYSGVTVESPNTSALAHVQEKYDLPNKFVLYLGTLEPRKNIASILKSFDAIAGEVSHDVVIAGERGWKEEQSLMAAFLTMKHQSRVHLIGFVPEHDKATLLAAADLFVYPSFYEGFGFPPLEALLSGTPVITSFNSSLPEVVGKWATLVDPYNTAELALVMKELLHDLPLVTEQTKQEIKAKYSWDKAARQTLNILEKMIKSTN